MASSDPHTEQQDHPEDEQKAVQLQHIPTKTLQLRMKGRVRQEEAMEGAGKAITERRMRKQLSQESKVQKALDPEKSLKLERHDGLCKNNSSGTD